MSKKVAIISGITGQDGSYLAELLLEKGYFVVGLKRRSSSVGTPRLNKIFQHPWFRMHYYDLNDASSIWRIINQYKPDEFYNLAAQSHVRVSFDVPEDTVNGIALGTLRLLEAVREISPKTKIYQASSSEMFGDNPDAPFNEESKLMPASPYACAKVFAHNLCRNYRQSYGLFVCCGILFNHESPRRTENFVTRKITQAAARIKLGKQQKLYLGNLEAVRDWGYAPEYMEAAWRMLQQDSPGDYVIATGEICSVKEFLEAVFEAADLPIQGIVEFDSRLLRPQEVPFLRGDASKAREVLGWSPTVTVKELAKMMYEEDLKLQKGEKNEC